MCCGGVATTPKGPVGHPIPDPLGVTGSLDFQNPVALQVGERQSIAQKGVRAIDARNSWLENHSNAAKNSVRAPGLSTDECEHPFVWYFGAGWPGVGAATLASVALHFDTESEPQICICHAN